MSPLPASPLLPNHPQAESIAKIRVGIDARYLRADERGVRPEGGVGRYLHNLLLHLVELAPDVQWVLFVPSSNRSPILPHLRVGSVEERPVSYPVHTLRTLFGFAREVNAARLSLFHAPSNVLPRGVKVPAVTTVHDMMWVNAPELCASHPVKRAVTGAYYRAGIGGALRQSARVLTVSGASREAILAHAPWLEGRVDVTHNGLDARFAPLSCEQAWTVLKPLLGETAPFVLSVGQGSPYKNHAKGIRAFASAFDGDPHIKLVLVRRFSRHDHEVNEALNLPALRGRVVLLPEVTDEQLQALYTAAHIFLFPSVCEGFGIPLLEAMACGAPCVAASFGAMAEVGGNAVLAVDTRNEESIAEGLKRLAADSALRSELSLRGPARARLFDWRAAAETTLQAYRAVLGARSGAQP